jgi:sodium/potassium-transporting ATPase subunit alpha
MQIANVFLCRSEREPLLSRGLMSNRLILAGIATEILIITLIVYTPWGHALFGTASIALAVWLFIIPFALGMLALEELRKWFVRTRPNPRATAIAKKSA